MTPPAPSSPDGRVRVAMATASGILRDGRVRKSAQAVAAAGHDVTLLYGRGDGDGPRDELAGVSTSGLLVRYELREAADVRPRRPMLPGAFDSARELAVARRRVELDRMRLADGGLRDRIRSRFQGVGLEVRAWQHGLQMRVDEARRRRAERTEPTEPTWEETLPAIGDLTLTFTRSLWRLEPDVVHIHDVHLLEAGVLAVRRLRARGARVRLVYDAHEYVPGLARRRNGDDSHAWQAMEAALIGEADAVVTVSEPIADALHERYGLRRRPVVVLNTPVLGDQRPAASDVRRDVGLPDDAPLLVYSGVVNPRRGLVTAVQGMAHLPDVALAVVCVSGADSPAAHALADVAAEAGVRDRVHIVDPVAPEEIVSYVATADAGVHPMIGGLLNHEMALPNKLFDYVYAGLPVVVSDLRLMGEFVRSRGLGTTFTPQDPEDFARAARQALDGAQGFRAAVADPDLRETFAWEAQAERLRALYAELLAD